jgi:hypothetical protein
VKRVSDGQSLLVGGHRLLTCMKPKGGTMSYLSA